MNIILPIISNLLILIFMITGMLIGKKNGWKIQLSKLILTAGAGVGFYFLAPIITDKLYALLEAQICNIPYSWNILRTAIIFILTIITYSILSLVIRLIANRHVAKKFNIVKLKIKGRQNRVINANNRKQFKLRLKEAKRQKRVSQVIGAILGIILSLILCFGLFMIIKYITLSVSEFYPVIEYLYEYTIFGQLDKIIKL